MDGQIIWKRMLFSQKDGKRKGLDLKSSLFISMKFMKILFYIHHVLKLQLSTNYSSNNPLQSSHDYVKRAFCSLKDSQRSELNIHLSHKLFFA